MLSGGGSPLETKDLVRAGLFTLERAIILSVSGSGYQGHMADADALFTYQVVCPSHTATCAAFNMSRIPHEPGVLKNVRSVAIFLTCPKCGSLL